MRQIQNKLVDNTTKTRIGPADTASKKQLIQELQQEKN